MTSHAWSEINFNHCTINSPSKLPFQDERDARQLRDWNTKMSIRGTAHTHSVYTRILTSRRLILVFYNGLCDGMAKRFLRNSDAFTNHEAKVQLMKSAQLSNNWRKRNIIKFLNVVALLRLDIFYTIVLFDWRSVISNKTHLNWNLNIVN